MIAYCLTVPGYKHQIDMQMKKTKASNLRKRRKLFEPIECQFPYVKSKQDKVDLHNTFVQLYHNVRIISSYCERT